MCPSSKVSANVNIKLMECFESIYKGLKFFLRVGGKVIQDLLLRGIHTIRKETEYKAALLYQALENHAMIKPFVTEKKHRSQTVIVADGGEQTSALTTYLQARGLYPGEGYGEFKKLHLRFANFPTHSKEEFESLVDALETFQ